VIDAGTMIEAFERAFPGVEGDTVRLVRAPGRVNLIGEHTDYNDGLVLPASIDLETWIAAAPSGSSRVEVALGDGQRDGFDLDRIEPARATWIDTVAGIAWSLGASGVALRGVLAVVVTEIPIGSGLSSSAAFQLASAWAMAETLPPMEPMELSLAARRAENDYVGVRSGIMDPFASSHGIPDHALLLDCRSLEFRPVPLPLESLALVVCDTRLPRRLTTSEYNARRDECERAVLGIKRHVPGIGSLRDVDATMLARYGEELDPVALRRATHVVNENVRVVECVAALAAGERDRLGALWADSHHSLGALYDVTSPELDGLVDIATATPGVVAARLTGAGFGGCTVNLVERDAVEELRDRVVREYTKRFGREPGVYPVEPVAGASEVRRP
jgi:galactokinase